MNLEIKYRAWDKKEKQMVYGIEETYDGLPYTEENKEIDLSIYDNMSCFSSWLCGDYEVMQYTGLTDTNGEEIYEGDVIKNIDNKTNVVNFKNGGFGIDKIYTIDYRTGKRHTSHEPLINWVIDGCEVIGSIY